MNGACGMGGIGGGSGGERPMAIILVAYTKRDRHVEWEADWRGGVDPRRVIVGFV